jgi:hypothetical protein
MPVAFIQLFDEFTGERHTLITGKNRVLPQTSFDFAVATVPGLRMTFCPTALTRVFLPQMDRAGPAIYSTGSY